MLYPITVHSVFHVQKQEYVGDFFLFIPIYSSLFWGVLVKSWGVLGHEIQSGSQWTLCRHRTQSVYMI